MAKKTKKPKKVVKKTKENKNTKEIKYLERLIELSLRNVTGKSEELDKLFTNQANRMKEQIIKLEANIYFNKCFLEIK
jgi:regulator of protease activity HflC (stomatin/prohibitin superfamily)